MRWPSLNVWNVYVRWFLLVSLAFFSVYPVCNAITAHRTFHYHFYSQAELQWPFLPIFVWPYLSLYLLFFTVPFVLSAAELPILGRQLVSGTCVSGLVFLLFPAQLGFARSIPSSALLKSIFKVMWSVDRPHNLVPSLHVVYSALILMAFLDRSAASIEKVLWCGWLGLLVLATLYVHQHHVADIFSGLVLAVGIRWMNQKGEQKWKDVYGCRVFCL